MSKSCQVCHPSSQISWDSSISNRLLMFRQSKCCSVCPIQRKLDHLSPVIGCTDQVFINYSGSVIASSAHAHTYRWTPTFWCLGLEMTFSIQRASNLFKVRRKKICVLDTGVQYCSDWPGICAKCTYPWQIEPTKMCFFSDLQMETKQDTPVTENGLTHICQETYLSPVSILDTLLTSGIKQAFQDEFHPTYFRHSFLDAASLKAFFLEHTLQILFEICLGKTVVHFLGNL